MRKLLASVSMASALLLACGPAFADKSDDTLVIAISDYFEAISPYDRPFDEASQFSNVIYGNLIKRDEYKQRWMGELAKSWTRVSPTTLEFELRDDVVFHSGNKFTADDVVYTVNWASDPKVKLPRKGGYLWVKKAEKLGPYKVRIEAKRPYALDLAQLAYRIYILDSKVHKSLANTADYGRVSASGTGPYRMVSLDRNSGVVAERFDGLNQAFTFYRAPIKRAKGVPVVDPETRIAQLLTGGVHVIRNPTADTTKSLATKPDLNVSVATSGTYMYYQIDSIARSGFEPLKDVRVRKALVMATNRREIAENFIAGDEPELADAICLKRHSGCAYTTGPYPYNPQEAKRLLAEAGYPNGIDVPFYVHSPYRSAAEAISGQLLKVGIRAKIEPLTISVYFKKRGNGELAIFMGVRPAGAFPQTRSIFDSYFVRSRDYWKDPEIKAAMKKADAEFDEAKRAKILGPALDRINELAYVMPIAAVPTVYVHSKNVRVAPNKYTTMSTYISDFFWK